jgi:hypothetical protein
MVSLFLENHPLLKYPREIKKDCARKSNGQSHLINYDFTCWRRFEDLEGVSCSAGTDKNFGSIARF